MDLYIRQGHIVVLIGPSAVGKTTLARRMCREAPINKTEIVAADREMTLSVIEKGFSVDAVEWWLANCIVKLDKAYQNGAFVVFDMPCTVSRVLADVFGTMYMIGLRMPMTVIKMYPNYDLQMEFAARRQQATAMDRAFLKCQHEEFAEIANDSMRVKFPWIRDEYLVTDPRDVKLKFVV